MITLNPAAGHDSADIANVRRISAGDLNWALAEGWRDFREKRGDILFVGVLYPVICLVAIVVTFNNPLMPLFFPLVAGLSIAGPAVASGFYELARRREDGDDPSWPHFLDPLRGRSRLPVATLTFMLGALFVGWLIVAYAIYGATFGVAAPLDIGTFLRDLFTTPAGWALITFGNLAGLAFAIVTLVVSVVSFPMVVDKPVDASVAIRTSIAATLRNPREIFGWGLRVAGLLFLGTLPAGIGLAIILPWLGYATWHLYTRLIER